MKVFFYGPGCSAVLQHGCVTPLYCINFIQQLQHSKIFIRHRSTVMKTLATCAIPVYGKNKKR
jgi:hypothetical protein